MVYKLLYTLSRNVSLGRLWLEEIRSGILILESFRFENENAYEYEITQGGGYFLIRG